MIQRTAYLKRSTNPIPRRTRPRQVKRGTRAYLARECAALWSRSIAPAGFLCFMRLSDGSDCSGPIDAAHIFGKKAHPAVRFEVWNGRPLCRRHHDEYTAHDEAWKAIFFQLWGADLYAQRYAQACRTAKLDLAAVRRELAA